MSWLTGHQIRQEITHKRITIRPFHSKQLNPNSYDYRLAPTIRILHPNDRHLGQPVINPHKPSVYHQLVIPKTGLLLEPHQTYLAHTKEIFGSDHFASLVTGKSSVARLFIQNHHCAGLIDQGFFGPITLEVTCQHPTLVFPNMRFGQIFWFSTYGPPLLYHGKYKSNNAARPSLIYKDIDDK